MKTPEEIKKGLKICSKNAECNQCPYVDSACVDTLLRNALAYIQQLESRLAQVERERDAALKEWKRTKMDSEGMCWTCKHGHITDIGSCRCVSPYPCDEGEEWQWRGVCEENTKEDNKC